MKPKSTAGAQGWGQWVLPCVGDGDKLQYALVDEAGSVRVRRAGVRDDIDMYQLMQLMYY